MRPLKAWPLLLSAALAGACGGSVGSDEGDAATGDPDLARSDSGLDDASVAPPGDAALPPPPTGMRIGANLWYLTASKSCSTTSYCAQPDWSGETAMKPNVDFATAYASGDNIWDPQFLKDIAPYAVLRFMVYTNTNWSTIVDWSARLQPTDARNAWSYSDGSQPGTNSGLAYEWLIDLCNRANKDLWINVPARSSPDYWTQLARLIKSKLNPNLRVYVEYSNENWNGTYGGQYGQFTYTIDQGVAGGLPGGNQWYQGAAFALWQSLKIFQAFQDELGAAAMGTRVIRVVAYSGNMDLMSQALASVLPSAKWNPQAQKIDLLASAPYPGRDLDGASPSIQADYHREIGEEIGGPGGRIPPLVADQKRYGIPMIGTYEGGPSLYNHAQAWVANPALYDEHKYMLDQLNGYGLSLHMEFTNVGRWADNQAWGAMDHSGQSDAPRYRAIVDWIHAH